MPGALPLPLRLLSCCVCVYGEGRSGLVGLMLVCVPASCLSVSPPCCPASPSPCPCRVLTRERTLDRFWLNWALAWADVSSIQVGREA